MEGGGEGGSAGFQVRAWLPCEGTQRGPLPLCLHCSLLSTREAWPSWEASSYSEQKMVELPGKGEQPLLASSEVDGLVCEALEAPARLPSLDSLCCDRLAFLPLPLPCCPIRAGFPPFPQQWARLRVRQLPRTVG